MKSRFVLLAVSVILVAGFVCAWDFYGYTYDTNRNALNNTLINITLWTMDGGPPTLVGSNSTTSYNSSTNGEGWFNVSVSENASYFYKPIITHTNSTTNALDYIGQSLPQFPFGEFNDTTDINFYLREAGTINITAINRTGGRISFQYQIKDTKLGYPIDENWNTYVLEANIYVPRDRNYSIMIYPNQSLPVSFDWNNFSSQTDYNIDSLSRYNVTKHTVHKQFNCTESLVRVTGYINATGINGWNEFTVVPYLLEPGDMIYLGENAGMPYNMSTWHSNATGLDPQTDEYNLSSGWYNITLPGPAESATYILFATARNLTDYYGSFRNITLGYGSSSTEFNFTMYGLLGDWGAADTNISLNNAADWSQVNISTAKQEFSLVNSTNSTLGDMSAHLEITVDYSDYNCMEFTFMDDLINEDASFSIPLINATGVKEINIFSMGGAQGEEGGSYAPKRASMSVDEINVNNNITLSVWDPGDREGDLDASEIFIKFYLSNSTCDVPNPGGGCGIGAFGPDENQSRENFSPLSAIMGGGKLSFRMGYGDIEIHYVNVDMLASGPPDVAFDGSATTSTSNVFSSALRFGSMGPTIYDYVLVSIPYIQGSSSQTGLNEDADVNMSIPLFYTGDNVDTLIWNANVNGTSALALAGNYSHYSAHQSEWGILMNQTNCTKNVSQFNSTNPCYIDTTNNQVWIRLPHFDGNEPSITGNVITATAGDDNGGSTNGGSGTPTNVTTKIKSKSWVKITPGAAEIWHIKDKELGIKQISVIVNKEAKNAKVTVTKYSGKPAEVTKEFNNSVYKYLQVKTTNLKNLTEAIITMQVAKSWVTDEKIAKRDIALFKFDEDNKKWIEITTTYKEEDSDYYYYEAKLISFSYFVIGSKIKTEPTPSPTASPSPTPTTTIPPEEKDKLKAWAILVIGLIVIVVVIGILFIVKSMKKGKKRKF